MACWMIMTVFTRYPLPLTGTGNIDSPTLCLRLEPQKAVDTPMENATFCVSRMGTLVYFAITELTWSICFSWTSS